MHASLGMVLIFVFGLLASPVTFGDDRLLACTGFGLQRLKKEKILLAKESISEKKLLSGEVLSLDFLQVLGFEVEHDGQNFVAYFTEEDVGVRERTRVNFKKLLDFKAFKTGTEIEMTDDEARRSYWRVEVICGVGGPS